MSNKLTIEEILDNLSLLTPESKPNPSLDRIEYILDMVGNPQNNYPSIHVTGTNGKTSTTRMIDSLLIELGYQTGRFTSPHLYQITDRISVNDQNISESDFIDLYQVSLPIIELANKQLVADGRGKLTFFEIITFLMFVYFAEVPVDVAIIEVGLGGRWDATNVINSQVAVFTPIDLDHTNYLGDNVLNIAREKLGIVKVNSPVTPEVVLGKQMPAVRELFNKELAKTKLVASEYEKDFKVLKRSLGVGGQKLTLQGTTGEYKDIFLPLFGKYQAENAATALVGVEKFTGTNSSNKLDIKAVRNAFASVKSPGRLEPIASNPSVFIDAAHNPAGAKALCETLVEDFKFEYLVGVVGIFADKDARGFLQMLKESFDYIVVTENSSSRALEDAKLAEIAEDIFGCEKVSLEPLIGEAINKAYTLVHQFNPDSSSGVGIIITGSIQTISEASKFFKEAEMDPFDE